MRWTALLIIVFAYSVLPPTAYATTLARGDIIVADQGNLVFRVDPNTGDRTVISSSSVGTGPSFSSPIDVSIEADLHLLVSGSGGVLLRVDPANGNRTVVSSSTVGSGPLISLFHSIAIQSDEGILVAGIFENAVFRVDPTTGNRSDISSSAVGTGPVFSPAFLTLGANDNEIFVASNGTSELFRIDATSGDRTLVSSAARGAGPSFGSLFDLVVGPDGRILVANGVGGSGPAVLAVDPNTGDRTALSSSVLGVGNGPAFGRPQSVAVQEDGSLVVADGLEGLFLVDPATGDRAILSSSTVGTGQEFVEALGIAIAPAGPCNDGLDNDEDGLIDYPQDTGCASESDPTEEPDCSDMLDNDEDGLTDFPDDPGCFGLQDGSEDDLGQCVADLGQCQSTLSQCLANQCPVDLAQCNADLTQSEADLGQCNSDLTESEADLFQCDADLQQCLATTIPDTDGDGIPDSLDSCGSTPQSQEVDATGCSQEQFCNSVDASAKRGKKLCKRSDWKNDEPAMKSRDRDCAFDKGGSGREDDRCVPVP